MSLFRSRFLYPRSEPLFSSLAHFFSPPYIPSPSPPSPPPPPKLVETPPRPLYTVAYRPIPSSHHNPRLCKRIIETMGRRGDGNDDDDEGKLPPPPPPLPLSLRNGEKKLQTFENYRLPTDDDDQERTKLYIIFIIHIYTYLSTRTRPLLYNRPRIINHMIIII